MDLFKDANNGIRAKSPDSASMSVIIPVYNDPKGLKDTLESLVNQDYPENDYEIIVADNGSTDDTLRVIKKFIKMYPYLIKLVEEDSIQSSYAARNKGIKDAKGMIIAFIDADMSVDHDWLTNIYKSLEIHQWDYLACDVEIYYKNKSIYEIYNKITDFPIKSFIYNNHFAPTCCLAVRRSVFKGLGLFDSRLISGGDQEFGIRVYESGYKMYHEESIKMRHPARSSFKELYEKYFRIGRGYQQLSHYYPERCYEIHRNIFNPINYLPNTIWGFFRSMEGIKVWDELSIRDKIKIYLVDCMQKSASIMGYIYEKFEHLSS